MSDYRFVKTERRDGILQMTLHTGGGPFQWNLDAQVEVANALRDIGGDRANRVIICDTDLWLTTIWSDVLFQKCPEWIAAEAARRKYDLYLLMNVDVPWVDDAQRYLPHQRQQFFDRCQALLEQQRLPYQVISGSWDDRYRAARSAVEDVLFSGPLRPFDSQFCPF